MIDAHPRAAGSFHLEVPAIADHLADIRRQLVSWLTPIGLSNTGIADIVLVVNEACTNCIEHAYRDTDPGLIRVEANHEGDHIVVDIADFGEWQPPTPEPSTRGRGLPIMRAVSDGVDLTTTDVGTTVHMTFDADAQGCGSRTT